MFHIREQGITSAGVRTHVLYLTLLLSPGFSKTFSFLRGTNKLMMHVHTPIFQNIISFLVLALWIINISAEAVFGLKEEIIWTFYLNFYPSFAINCLGHADFSLSSVEKCKNVSYSMLLCV